MESVFETGSKPRRRGPHRHAAVRAVLFWGAPLASGSFPGSSALRSALLKMTDGNEAQLQRHQKLLWEGGTSESHLGPAAAALVWRTDCRRCQSRTASPQSPDKLPPLIFLAFDLESDVGSVDMSPGVDQEPMCFQWKPDPRA